MAENSRRVTYDQQGNPIGGLKPIEGSTRIRTQEDLDAMERNRADIAEMQKRRAEESYQQRLAAYKRGDPRGAGLGFRVRPEDEKAADDARGLSLGQRDKSMSDKESFEDANRPQGRTGAFPAEMETPGYNVIKPRAAQWDSSTGEWKMPQGMKKGGKVSSASSRADGIAQRGKTKGRMCQM